jgi:mxaJ protein
MSSRCLESPALALLLALTMGLAAPPAHAQGDRSVPDALRVCVDPDNLPYSHADGRGYEPRLARLLADALERPLQLQWQPMRRGSVRKTLGEGRCEVLMSAPVGWDRVLTTRPYYRSSYVFVARADDPRPLRSFDDARLAELRIGVQLVGDDGAATPPGHALVQRGAIARVVGYTVDGGSGDEAGRGSAAERIVEALQRGALDAALVWGPQVGWWARQASPPLQLARAQAPDGAPLPFEFSIALGVRRGDTALRDRLQAALDARRAQIDALLDEHGVPRLPMDGAR